MINVRSLRCVCNIVAAPLWLPRGQEFRGLTLFLETTDTSQINEGPAQVELCASGICKSGIMCKSNYAQVELCTSRTMRKWDYAQVELCSSRIVHKSHYAQLGLCASGIMFKSNYAQVGLCRSRIMRKWNYAHVELCTSRYWLYVWSTRYVYTKQSSWDPNSSTLEPDRLMHDHPTACVITQQYTGGNIYMYIYIHTHTHTHTRA